MKLALFSDIHANLPAFESFLKDVHVQKPDAIYCLGDLVGYNVWPNEIVSYIRDNKIATLAGNHDLKVKALMPIGEEELKLSGKAYAYHIIDESHRNYLSTLPAHIKLEFQLKGRNLSILFVHGSPRNVDEYVLEDTSESYVLEMMNEAGADILCVGHSHKPYHRVIPSATGVKEVVNIGSVGKPKDGNPKGCYVLLTINDTGISVNFRRFDYDIEKAARAIEVSPLPDEFADMLRKAY